LVIVVALGLHPNLSICEASIMKKHAGNFLFGLFGVAALALATGCSDDAPDGGGGNTGGGAGTGGGTGNELLTTDVKAMGWVGGDPMLTEDNPAGIQGAFYMYGDDGASCTLVEGNPCTADGCCIQGHTIIDSTFAAWGCGIGLSLNDSGGMPSVKSPFAGSPNVTFNFTLSGNTGNNPIRVGFTQFADTAGLVSPYKEVAAFTDGTSGNVSFATATYPTWCTGNPGCLAPPDRAPAAPSSPAKAEFAHDIQFQIPGGDRDGDFNFCITSLQVSE
jgi:hypothetical protein